MDYERVYREFIADRRRREGLLTEAFDRHHVLPRCLGGGDGPENIVRLTYGDHLFAHVLLAKVHGGKLAVSANRMAGMRKYRGRHSRERYTHLRAAHVAAASARRPSAEECARISTAKMGWDPSPETRANMSASAKRRSDNPEWRARHGEVMRGNQHFLGKTHGPSTRRKLSEASRGNRNCVGRVVSPETRAKISTALKRRAEERRNAL